MKQWMEIGTYQVNQWVTNDREYQQLLEEINHAQAEYLAIMSKLSPQEYEKVENYIALCENLEYQRTIAAWYSARQGLEQQGK